MSQQTTAFVSPKSLAAIYPDLFTVATLQRWRTEGVGPPYTVLGPRRIAYSLAAIDDWMAERTVKSTAAARERQRELAA